jgi:hypothetical protein
MQSTSLGLLTGQLRPLTFRVFFVITGLEGTVFPLPVVGQKSTPELSALKQEWLRIPHDAVSPVLRQGFAEWFIHSLLCTMFVRLLTWLSWTFKKHFTHKLGALPHGHCPTIRLFVSSQHSGLSATVLPTWWLAFKRGKMDLAAPLIAGPRTLTLSLLPHYIGQRFKRRSYIYRRKEKYSHLFWDRVSLCYPDWPSIPGLNVLSVSASQVFRIRGVHQYVW